MVIEPINLSTFRTNFSLNSTVRNLGGRLNVDDNFLDDIASAFASEESPADDDLFDPALEVDNPALGRLGNAFNGDRSDGIPLDVSGGTVTLEPGTGSERLNIEPFHSVSVRETSENSLTVLNETTGEALRLERGESLQVRGDGQAELVAGDGSTLRLESGEALTVKERDGSLKLEEQTFRNELTLNGGAEPLAAIGESGSEIAIYTGPNESIRFQSGQAGTVSTLEDGSVRIKNESTGESLTVNSLKTLKAEGNAELVIGSESEFQIEEGDKVTLTSTDDGLTLRNRSITGSVSASTSPEDSDQTDDNPFRLMANPVSEQIRVFENLLDGSVSNLGVGANNDTSDQRFGSVNEIIEPLSERTRNELLNTGLSLEESRSPFFAERQVAEPFEQLPEILSSEENEGLFNEEFSIVGEDESEPGILEAEEDDDFLNSDDGFI